MTIATLATFEKAGIRLSTPDGEALHVDAPSGTLTEAMREHLRTHKAELLHQLQRREAAAYPARGWLLIWSKHLQEVVVLVRDEQAAEHAPAGFITYTEAEIEHLRDITPDALRQVHEAKKFWNGRITGREATEHGDYDRSNSHRDGQ